MLKRLRSSLRIFFGACLCAICSLMTPTAYANLIDFTHGAGAGSFELGNFVNGGGNPNAAGPDYMGLLPGDTTITGWTVGGPGDGVDWLTTPGFGADTGVHAVDLQHLSVSSIATVIPTIAGAVYDLSFSVAAVLGLSDSGIVSAGSLVNQAFTVTQSFTSSNQAFTPFSFLFTATGPTTTITFQATGPNSTYGPVIDSVSVDATATVPEPGTVLLLGTGLVNVLGYGWRRRDRRVNSD